MTEETKFRRFEAADHLDDLDDVTAYLEIALQESADDPTAVPRALGVIARSQNMSELARRVGMSRDGLYKALSAEGNPTWSTVLKVTNALGLRLSGAARHDASARRPVHGRVAGRARRRGRGTGGVLTLTGPVRRIVGPAGRPASRAGGGHLARWEHRRMLRSHTSGRGQPARLVGALLRSRPWAGGRGVPAHGHPGGRRRPVRAGR